MHRVFKNWNMKICFSFIFLLLLSDKIFYSQTQNLKFEGISIEQGLSQNTVNCIFQDSHGFLWFGTQDGLNKFDGYKFTVFKNDPSDSTSPSDNNFLYITEDNYGDLWCGTELGGMNKYDYSTGKFIHYSHDPKNPNSISYDYISVIYRDKKGIFWIGTQTGGLNKFDPKTKIFHHYKYDQSDSNSLSNNTIYSICEDTEGFLWIGTLNGLNKFDKNTGKFKRFYLEKYFSAKANAVLIYSLFISKDGILWIGTYEDGLISYDKSLNKFKRFQKQDSEYSLCSNKIESIYEDSEGRFWIGTDNGLNEFNRSKNLFFSFRKNIFDFESLSDNDIVSIYEDKSHNIWFGTLNGGVNKLVKEKEKFSHIKSDYGNPFSLSNNNINGFCEDKIGNLWIATFIGGLNRWDRKSKKFIYYKHSPLNSNSIASDRIWAIAADNSDNLWIGTDNGLDKLNLKTNRFTHYKHNPKDPFSLTANDINSLLIDRAGNLWIGTWSGGLDRFDISSNKFYHLKNIPGNYNSIASDAVLTTIQDRKGNLWIGTWENGLDKYDPINKKFTHYSNNKNNPYSIKSNTIMSLYEDTNGRYIWVGTNTSGLNRLDLTTGKFDNFTEKEGLPNNLVYGILGDDNGNVWISTNKGICKFNPINNSFESFRSRNGLQSNEFNQGAFFKNNNGEMFFGGINGFNLFKPKEILKSGYIPKIVITSFKKFDKIYLPGKPISEIKEIELSYKDYMFSFEFASLDYTYPENNKFAYKMEGLDKDWILLDNNHSATFTNLNPGRYIFKVKGTNCDGKWNEAGTSIVIIIRPPYWRTLWFNLLLGAAVILSVVSFFKYRTEKIKLQNIKLEKLVKERTNELTTEISIRKRTEEYLKKSELQLRESNNSKDKFFSIIAHDLKSPFHSLLGYSSLLSQDFDNFSPDEVKKSITVLNKSVSRIYNLVENLLEWSRLQTNRIEFNPALVNLANLANHAISFLEMNALSKGITITNEITENTFVSCDENMIISVFQNIISNAIKFSNEGGKINIQSKESGDKIEVSIVDNGVGIDKNNLDKLFKIDVHHTTTGTGKEQGTGLGLILCKELIEKNGGEIRIVSELGNGTSIIFTLLKHIAS
jgi:ligand-binding sensor domain-containing protein/signal transduction histidine kinase